MLTHATSGHDRFHTICGKLHRDEAITAAEARAYACWCERIARANNCRQFERLVYFVRVTADNHAFDPDLAAADLFETLGVESVCPIETPWNSRKSRRSPTR